MALAATFAARPLGAQIGFESLWGGVTDISISGSCWNTRSEFLREEQSCPNKKIGYGVEVIWNLRSIPIGKKPDGEPDTAWVLAEKDESFRGGQVDSVRHYTVQVNAVEDERPRVLIEVGLGYSQFSGFESADPEYELRGMVREIPAVNLYGTLNWDRLGPFKPYLGVRSGLIQLHNVQLYDSITADTAVVYFGSAQTFQLGGIAGLAFGASPVHVFGEFAYNLRRFPSVQWGTAGTNRLPDTLFKSFDFSGISLSVGLQVSIRPRP
ncbi:MAG TPA: hypothetical protein VF142_20205 [Longimicrobium sp.]